MFLYCVLCIFWVTNFLYRICLFQIFSSSLWLVLGFPVDQLVKNPPAMQETLVWSWVRKIPWRRDKLPSPVFLGFPGGSDGKESTCNVGDLGLIPWLGRSTGGGHGNPLQYSCLENPHCQRSLEGYSPWGCKELDMTEQLSTAQHKLYRTYIFYIYMCIYSIHTHIYIHVISK